MTERVKCTILQTKMIVYLDAYFVVVVLFCSDRLTS